MSKKKEINLKSTPAAVESGDVNITYNNVLVGSLSESGSAVLKTEMTICEHDIELEYTKAAGQSIGNALTFTNNSSMQQTLKSVSGNADHIIVNNQLGKLTANSMETVNGILLCNNVHGDKYNMTLSIVASADIYNVTVNELPFRYASLEGSYVFTSSESDEPIVGQTYNVVITDKV